MVKYNYNVEVRYNMERNYLTNPLTIDDIKAFKTQQAKCDNNKIYSSENDFVFIHKTNYPPNNNEIKSTFSAGATYTENGILFNIPFKYDYPVGDDYIHFSLNCEVRGRNRDDIYGFNNRKYAIVVPGNEDEFKKISRFCANDVEFKGTKNITNCYLLCPIVEYETIKSNNPNAYIIPYIGDYVDCFVETFINQLGYTVENTDDRICMWLNSEQERVSGVIDKYGFTFEEYGMDRFISNRNVQQSLKYNSFLKKILSISCEKEFNIFDVISNIDEIVDENNISLSFLRRTKTNIPLDNIQIENEEEKSFWNEILNNNNSYNKYFLINLIASSFPFEMVKEHYSEYSKNKKSY